MPTYSHESLIPLMINERLLSSRAVDARLYNTRVNSCFLSGFYRIASNVRLQLKA